ncbi:hypothetical protein LHYA1_G003706 [Lachnellula hyalina]|uniref:DUF7137 domain-containing protein n=1 Tax=Lachnellula hyalina TaxID=1316788 RepID=A0A8H8QZ30_9HELO|nr:uncharacterized protein LHYA1_G003706 [Lachnellula hyalina]TVY25379.1 hypothetical protein LHYA1_G003706 [Lachnellula hyalina]
MRTSRSLQIYSLLFILLATFTAAWPWPRWLPERDSLIAARDDNTTGSAQATTTQESATATATDNKSSATDTSATDTKSDSLTTDSKGNTITATDSSSPSTTDGSSTGTITKAATTDSSDTATSANSTSYDATNPAGGVSLMTPAVSAGSQYYKIGSNVTFGWNYTSLLGTPSAINVMATCTANQQLYTIAANQTVANNTGVVTWDTGAYQATALSNPLLVQTYTLIIYDAGSSISATAQPGYMSVYDSYTFGMYTPQPYTDLSGWKCATCSGALGETERRALGLMVGMAVLTVCSFGWFVNGLGVIW